MNRDKLEKVKMATARQFSYGLKRAGTGAEFSKFDIKNAYKLIPAKVKDYRLQGFCWLGKYFVETQQTFGGVPSVCNFDRLARTKDVITCIISKTPRSSVYRVLDDTPCVAKKESGRVERFSVKMRELCKYINLPLAENCPNTEKAFERETRGVILGIGFDSKKMTWFLQEEKADKIIQKCLQATSTMHMDLRQTQSLMGSVNDIGQMCPLLKFHRVLGIDI